MSSAETWLPVEGYEGRYWISNLGRLRNANWLIKRHQVTNSGYAKHDLYSGGKASRKIATTHRMVAKAFVPNPEGKPEVNHKDGDKSRNHSENLEWSTRLENVAHSISQGLIPPNAQRKPVVGIARAGGREVRFDSIKDAELHFSGKKTSAIQHSMKRQNGTAFSHRWIFV